jgi:hypothetical protein
MELLKAAQLQVHVFKDFITPAALITFMERAVVSTEIHGKLVHKTPVIIYASELGNLINPRSGVRELTLLLAELFNKQGDHEDTTDKRGVVKIKNPNLTCMLCCFPEWVHEELVSISLRSGFFGRMMVVTEYARRHANIDIKLDHRDIKLKADLINDLEHIGSLYGEMIWDDKTKPRWDKWFKSLPIDFRDSEDTIEVRGFTSRKAQFVQRLAMLSALSKNDEGDRLILTQDDFTFGLKLVDQCEENTRNIGVIPVHIQYLDKIKRNILRLQELLATDKVPIRKLHQRIYRYVPKKDLEEGITQLCDIGFCQLEGRHIRVLKSD